jgi:hypothetical protein
MWVTRRISQSIVVTGTAETVLAARQADYTLRARTRLTIGGTMTQRVHSLVPALTWERLTYGTFSCISARMLLAAILLFPSFPIKAIASETPSQAIAPKCRIDLRTVVTGAFAFSPWGSPEGRSGPPIRSLWFLDNSQLAISVVTRVNGEPGLASREGTSNDSPYRLHAVLVDAASGKVRGVPEWPSNSRYTGIIAANDRGFVTEAGRELTLYSSDLTPIKRITLPPLKPDQSTHERYWAARPSWSGRRVLFIGESGLIWLDAENLQILKQWDEVLKGPVTASDDQLIVHPFARHFGEPESNLMSEVPGASWKSIPSTTYASEQQFVGDNLLFFHRCAFADPSVPCGAFLMQIDSGEASRLKPPREGWGLGAPAASRDDKRFVVLVGEEKGQYPAFDISGHSVLKAVLATILKV